MPIATDLPTFFCALGDPAASTQAYQSSFAAVTDPVPWPYKTFLRIKFMDTSKVHASVLQQVIRSTERWSGSSIPSLQWVKSDETADIRISFDNKAPNWSAVGKNASSIGSEAATMNLSLGGWKERKIIYPDGWISRAAAHLIGHALGLPHAKNELSSSWDQAALSKYGNSSFTDRVQWDGGCSQLVEAYSIMAIDRPSELRSPNSKLGSRNNEFYAGGNFDEAKRTLQRVYPYTPVYSSYSMLTNESWWKGGVDPEAAVWTITTLQTSNIISGLYKLDIGLSTQWLNLTSHAKDITDQGYKISLNFWTGSEIHDGACSYMSFDREDKRIQSGEVSFLAISGDANKLPPGGSSFSKRINFNRPFSSPPSVITWLTDIDHDKKDNIRINIYPEAIDAKGFTIWMRTWDGSVARNMMAGWLAHDADSETLFSGVSEPPTNPDKYHSWTEPRQYSAKLKRRPTNVFWAISGIDATCAKNVRLRYEKPELKEKELTVKFDTWYDESDFYWMKGVWLVAA